MLIVQIICNTESHIIEYIILSNLISYNITCCYYDAICIDIRQVKQPLNNFILHVATAIQPVSIYVRFRSRLLAFSNIYRVAALSDVFGWIQKLTLFDAQVEGVPIRLEFTTVLFMEAGYLIIVCLSSAIWMCFSATVNELWNILQIYSGYPRK